MTIIEHKYTFSYMLYGNRIRVYINLAACDSSQKLFS